MSVPDTAKIVEALNLLGATDASLAKFPVQPDDLAFSFADALIDSPGVIYTDWRYHPAEALNDVWQCLYPHGIKGMIEEDDPDNGFPKKIILQHNGVGSRYRIKIKEEEPNWHHIVFALAKVLPADVQVLSLLPYEATDTYLHIVQPTAVIAQVRELLGPWSEKVFAVHESPLQFIKTGGNVKPKMNLAKNYLKGTKEWLVNNADMHREWLEEIEKTLACKDMRELETKPFGATEQQRQKALDKFLKDFPLPRRFFLCTLKLDYLLLRIRAQGVIDVLEKRPAGWQAVHLSMQYDVLSLHLSQQWGWKRELEVIPDKSGRLLALAWTLGDMGVVRWLSEEIIRVPTNFCGWRFTPLQPFLLSLYARWQNKTIHWNHFPKAKLGLYQKVFDAWDDPSRLAIVLEQCCDYHLLRTGESGYQEYYDSPFNIIPVEIHAIHRLREMQGLPMPTIKHALMDTPLGVMPAPVVCPPDDLLQRIMSMATAETPAFAEQLSNSQ